MIGPDFIDLFGPAPDPGDGRGSKENSGPITEAQGRVTDREQIEHCIRQLEARRIDITAGYDRWYRIGFAFVPFGEEGREYFHRVSAINAEYDRQECDRKFSDLLKNYNGRIRIGTFFEYCKEAGIDLVQSANPLGPSALALTQTAAPELPQESQAPEDIFAKYAHLRITASLPIKAPTPIVKFGEADISTEGNITVFSGDSKAGKSALCSVILAGAIAESGTEIDGFEGIEVAPNYKKHAVIHIDTEQARHHHYRNLKNAVLKRAGLTEEPEHFLSYNIREEDPKHYRQIVSEIFHACREKFGGIHLVLIDGIADFTASVNDEEESNRIVNEFERLSIEYSTPILTVIHFNPNSTKQRGHMGSQLQRKAESVIAVKREEDVSWIEPQFTRSAGDSDIPRIQFKYDKLSGYHRYIGVREEQQGPKEISKLRQWAVNWFSDTPVKYGKAIELIMDQEGCSKRTANDKLKAMAEIGLIHKLDGNAGYVLHREAPEEETPEDPDPEFPF